MSTTVKRVDQMIQQNRPPTCFHILGQGLANVLWAEGRNLRDCAVAVLDEFQGQELTPAMLRLERAVYGQATLTTDEAAQTQTLTTD